MGWGGAKAWWTYIAFHGADTPAHIQAGSGGIVIMATTGPRVWEVGHQEAPVYHLQKIKLLTNSIATMMRTSPDYICHSGPGLLGLEIIKAHEEVP